ncbi:MAG: hypothetical protein U1E67_14170 [Hyphomicrobiales bacterium]
MISSDDLVLRAREVVNPRELSPTVGVGDVGCALETEKGTVYVGVSIDTAAWASAPEHNAIGTMIINGESWIVKLAAVDWNGGSFRRAAGAVSSSTRPIRAMLIPS